MMTVFAKGTYSMRHDDSWSWPFNCVQQSRDGGSIDCFALNFLISVVRCHGTKWTGKNASKPRFELAMSAVRPNDQCGKLSHGAQLSLRRSGPRYHSIDTNKHHNAASQQSEVMVASRSNHAYVNHKIILWDVCKTRNLPVKLCECVACVNIYQGNEGQVRSFPGVVIKS